MSQHASIRDIVIGLIFQGVRARTRPSRPRRGTVPGFRATETPDGSAPPRSIALRLFLVFLFLLLLVILLGTLAIGSLSYSNAASSQVRDRWLPSTRVLGDLNNFTSDHRVAEASLLLSADARDLATHAQQLEDLDGNIRASEVSYSRIPSGELQQQLNRQFQAEWSVYRELALRVRSLAVAGELSAARALYNTTSRAAYEKASHTFDLLNQSNVDSARTASLKSASAYYRAQWAVVLTILLAGAATATATLYVRRSISGPLIDLAACMHRLAANQTGVQVDETDRDDEIGAMARAVVVFRHNAIELATSRRALEQQATMLQEKLAEEQRLMQLQRNFVSMVSHEFRTPLTIIDAHAQRLIARREQFTPDELAERAQKIRITVVRMTSLIHNLVDAARLIDGELELYFHPAIADLSLLLHEVCLLHGEITPHARILEEFSDASLHIVGDSNLLFQVFSNLLANAIKYSPGVALIKVTAHCQDDQRVMVSVEDQGIGIPEAECQRVFDRYYRASNAGGITGTGVGLYFVKMVVELHGGTVEVESGAAQGSRFTISLPVRPLRAPSDAASRSDTPTAMSRGGGIAAGRVPQPECARLPPGRSDGQWNTDAQLYGVARASKALGRR
jgi:two-component system, OmpR family, sensor kinase